MLQRVYHHMPGVLKENTSAWGRSARSLSAAETVSIIASFLPATDIVFVRIITYMAIISSNKKYVKSGNRFFLSEPSEA